jgi:hypothetical protein
MIKQAPPRTTLKRPVRAEEPDDDDPRDYPVSKVKKRAAQASRIAPASERRGVRTPAPSTKLFEVAVAQTRSTSITPQDDLSEEERQLQTVFGAAAGSILELLEFGDTDGATSLIQKKLLQSLVGLLPAAEGYIQASKGARGVHGYNLLVGQMRELLADLQALRDRGALGQSIVERHLRPSYLDLGVQIQLAFTRIDAEATARMEDKQDINDFRKEVSKVRDNLAQFMTSQYQEVSTTIAKALT